MILRLDEQVDQFMQEGYIILKGAFSKEKAAAWSEDVWIRLDMDPNDMKTWDREWINMPGKPSVTNCGRNAVAPLLSCG